MAVARQNKPSAAAPKRACHPTAIAIPAMSCKPIVATSASVGTPALPMLADAAAKFMARNTPSWTKIHASNRRLASKTKFSIPAFRVTGTLSIDLLPLLSAREKRVITRPLRSSIACRFGADCLLKVFTLFAAARAEFRKDGKLLLGLLNIAGLNIELAEILAGRLVVRLKFQCLGVIGQRRFEVAGLAQGEAKQIVDIGLLDVLGKIPQLRESGGVVLGLDLGADRSQVRCIGRLDVVDRKGWSRHECWREAEANNQRHAGQDGLQRFHVTFSVCVLGLDSCVIRIERLA